jgi:hypothetical protein
MGSGQPTHFPPAQFVTLDPTKSTLPNKSVFRGDLFGKIILGPDFLGRGTTFWANSAPHYDELNDKHGEKEQ